MESIDPRIMAEETRRQIDNDQINDTGHIAGLDPHKYKVFDENGVLDEGEFFVLRRGDAMAISTLRSYAASIMTLLDLCKIGMITLRKEQVRHLIGLADDVTHLAHKWENDEHIKLPD